MSFLFEPELGPVTRSQPSTLSLRRKYFHWIHFPRRLGHSGIPRPLVTSGHYSYLLRGSVWLALAMVYPMLVTRGGAGGGGDS